MCASFCVSVYILFINFNDIISYYYSILFLFFLHHVFALSSIAFVSFSTNISLLCPFVYLFRFCYHLQTFRYAFNTVCVYKTFFFFGINLFNLNKLPKTVSFILSPILTFVRLHNMRNVPNSDIVQIGLLA